MRIIAGQWRGRTLIAPAGLATRPTADRARETLFSMLTSRTGGFGELRVADLFAGSGALGLEALSRGAASCLFVDQDPKAIAAIRANVAALGATSAAVRAGPAERIAVAEPLDLVFVDPPYGSGLGSVAASALAAAGSIATGGVVVIETAFNEHVPPPPGFTLLVEREVGKARLTLLRTV